jgi:TPR repeat protein
VLKQALDPARSFPSAREFDHALGRLDGLQVTHREIKPAAPAPRPPAARATPPPAKPTPSPTPAFVPPQSSKTPLILIGAAAAIIVACVAAVFFLQKPTDPTAGSTEPHPLFTDDGAEVTPNGQLPSLVSDHPPAATPIPATPAPATPAPATPPPAPTRQELVQAAVKKAQEFEEKGDWDQSVKAWLQVAKDYPEFAVGRNHLETLLNKFRERPSPISPQEFREMRTLITEAAQLDVLSGMMLLADNTREQEPVTAFNWYSTAAKKEHAPALTQLGLMFSNNTVPGTPDLPKAVECFKLAAEKGDFAAKAALGDCYLSGKGIVEDKNRALELYREAAGGGDVRAMNRLGDILYKMGAEAVKKNLSPEAFYTEAFQLFTKASDRGSLDALGNLGVLYLNGEGATADPRKAASLFEKGAKGENPFCMYLYARCLEHGIGIKENLIQAQNMYRKAAEAGDRRAADWCRKNSVLFTPKG